MASVEAQELYALKWGNHNTFLTQRLYEQCRVSAVSRVITDYPCVHLLFEDLMYQVGRVNRVNNLHLKYEKDPSQGPHLDACVVYNSSLKNFPMGEVKG